MAEEPMTRPGPNNKPIVRQLQRNAGGSASVPISHCGMSCEPGCGAASSACGECVLSSSGRAAAADCVSGRVPVLTNLQLLRSVVQRVLRNGIVAGTGMASQPPK